MAKSQLLKIIAENTKRNAVIAADRIYNPLTGQCAQGNRTEWTEPFGEHTTVYLPDAMIGDDRFDECRDEITYKRMRCMYDFEYWSALCVTIRDKESGRDVPFVLNRPQRRVLGVMEGQRMAGKPIRLIMLKARQWGGSTLVQMYMAWIQCCHRRNWNSLICAHVKDTSAQIRGMYTKVLQNYPPDLWMGDKEPSFEGFERALNTRIIGGRGCKVTVSSAENQDAIRGSDIAMAHLSEVAFWPATVKKTPADLIRAVCGSVAFLPYTVVIMESTANGVGNFFHNEWLRAERCESDKEPVFVPWHEIDLYRLPVDDKEVPRLWDSLTAYERKLWKEGVTLEAIKWFHNKAKEYASLDQMLAEYPGTPIEAFSNSGANVFDPKQVERLRGACRKPALVGDVFSQPDTAGIYPCKNGNLKVWAMPDCKKDYVLAIDVGGRSLKSDCSVMSVLQYPDYKSKRPVTPVEVVAQWRGHCDHDVLAAKAISLARTYNDALLIIESNTVENEESLVDGSMTVLEYLGENYSHCYTRQYFNNQTMTMTDRIGFYSNRRTKPMLIDALIAAIREGNLVERDEDAVEEYLTYCQNQNGSYGPRPGCHDDILMTRALGLYAIQNKPPLPELFLPLIPVW